MRSKVKMGAGGHFVNIFNQKVSYWSETARIFFLNCLPPVAVLYGTTMSIIELVHDIWMSNACVKFEERSLNPSKVIALITKLCGGGFVADENIIFPEYGSEMARNVIESEFRTSTMADRSEMARNAIESEFRTSKMADGSHYAKNFKDKFKLHIDLKWPEMRSKVNFGLPKWAPAAIL